MGATAVVSILATASGLSEGGVDQVSFSLTNTSATGSVNIVTLGTAVSVLGQQVVYPTSARILIAIPPSTNTFPWRVAPSTVDVGVPISSNGVFMAASPGGSSFHFYTTAGTAFNIRVLTY